MKYKFLYYKPGKLLPSEGNTNWFLEEDISTDDLRKELFSLKPTTFLKTFIELFLMDELNPNSLLSFLGDHEERQKGLSVLKEKPVYLFEMIILTSEVSSVEKRLESILITMSQEVDMPNLLASKFRIDIFGSTSIISNFISSTCTGVVVKQSFGKNASLLLVYQR